MRRRCCAVPVSGTASTVYRLITMQGVVGESEEASRSSLDDISSGRRGGLRSHKGAQGRTRDQLYNEARQMGIEGRSKMNKAELQRAVDAKK